jgi:galactokinase
MLIGKPSELCKIGGCGGCKEFTSWQTRRKEEKGRSNLRCVDDAETDKRNVSVKNGEQDRRECEYVVREAKTKLKSATMLKKNKEILKHVALY